MTLRQRTDSLRSSGPWPDCLYFGRYCAQRASTACSTMDPLVSLVLDFVKLMVSKISSLLT